MVFPYVDLKHLHGLETFTVGHNIIDLESTALYDIKGIIEFEANNCYSQNKMLFFVYGLDKPKIQDIMSIEGIRCILNTNDDVKSLAYGNQEFMFYNKKNNSFLNYQMPPDGLEFERQLITSSQNQTILLEKIQQIKTCATKIFTEINTNPEAYESSIPKILQNFDPRYWEKILNFTRTYFQIIIPVKNYTRNRPTILKTPRSVPEENVSKITEEFQFIKSLNKNIANEFMKLLHVYRSEKVNPAHLELEQMYHPHKLYVYLRTHHWKDGIDPSFFSQLAQMKLTGLTLSEKDKEDFGELINKFGIKVKLNHAESHEEPHVQATPHPISLMEPQSHSKGTNYIPSTKNFNEYKEFIEKRWRQIDALLKRRELIF